MGRYRAYDGEHEITCHVCLQEVSHPGAMSAEGKEYLYFFCGQECYVHWQHESRVAGLPVTKHV